MEQRVEAAAADLERERAANASLQLTSSLLVAVTQQKDSAVQVLQQAAAAGSLGAAGDARQQQSPAAAAAGQLAPAADASGGAASIRLLAMPFEQRVDLCCRLFRNTEPAQQTVALHGVQQDDGEVVDGFALDMRCAAHHASNQAPLGAGFHAAVLPQLPRPGHAAKLPCVATRPPAQEHTPPALPPHTCMHRSHPPRRVHALPATGGAAVLRPSPPASPSLLRRARLCLFHAPQRPASAVLPPLCPVSPTQRPASAPASPQRAAGAG